MTERYKYEDGFTQTEKVNGGQETPVIVVTEPKEKEVFYVGITGKQIEKQVEPLVEETTRRYLVDDITKLPNELCETLQCGDTVVKISGQEKHGYHVVYKKYNELALVYCDYHTIEEIYYEISDGDWTAIPKEVRDLDTLFAD